MHLSKLQPKAVSDTKQPAEEIQEATAGLAAANQISLVVAAEALKAELRTGLKLGVIHAIRIIC